MPVCMSSPVAGHKASRGQTCGAAWQSKDQMPVCQPAQAALATQPHKTLCTRWMGFPQAQEPANWELSKVPAIFWEKISLSSAAPGGTLWARKALLTGNKGYTACVRVVDTRKHIGRNPKVSTCK